jgi:PIN domain nuclease of toxin-antitoxin system
VNLAMDSSALIAFLKDEPGAEVVERLLLDSANTCYVHAVNLCEVYYDFLRRGGEETAQAVLSNVAAMGIVLSEEMDKDMWQQAGRHKAYLKLPLGDCFLLAMTSRIQGQAVTADRKDLEPIEADGKFPIRFIR